MRLAADIEADGFLYGATQIWCIVSKDIDTGKLYISPDDMSHEEHIELFRKADLVIFHNGLGYDWPLLEKLYNYKHLINKQADTFIMSSLFDPDRSIPMGCSSRHSIKSWGLRFKMHKGDFSDFSAYTPEMLEYCIRDVEICAATYRQLLKDAGDYDWGPSLILEYRMMAIQSKQEQYGVAFDPAKAYDLVEVLMAEITDIENEVIPQIPVTFKQFGVDVKPFLKAGGYTKAVRDWYEQPEIVGGVFCRVEWHKINLNSDVQVKKYLLSQGWRPTTWNFKKGKDGKPERDDSGSKIKTSPKLTEDSYSSVEGDIPKLVARRNTLLSRRRQVFNITKQGQLKGWLNLLRTDGRIEAQGTPQATPTGRYRHRVVVNVPKVHKKVAYGKEMRELFTVDEGRVLVGGDASALEANMEAHHCYNFTGGHEYAFDLTEGDIHAKNAILFGTDRDGAKSPKYAIVYGSGAETLAETIGCSKGQAQVFIDNFWDGNTALSEFKESLEREYRRNGRVIKQKTPWGGTRDVVVGGWIRGLDGRKLKARSPHALVNLAFQSSGSIVVKTATVYMDKWIKAAGLDTHQVIHMHDEYQFDTHPDDVEEMLRLIPLSFQKAGEYWKLNVPLTGDVKYGNNWAETH